MTSVQTGDKSALRFTTLVVGVVFAVYAALIVFDLVRAHGEAAPYFIGDWQINYVAGFVRRGLFGEFARVLFVHFAIDTRTTIVAMQALFYVVFFASSSVLLAPVVARHPMFAFAVFSPMTVAFKALDSGIGATGLNPTTGAKDIVFLALLSVQAVLSTRARTDPASSDGRLLILALVFGAAVLVHEGFFFFLPFSLAMLVLTARQPVAPFKLGLLLLPALLAFAASAASHGDPSFGAAICTSLGAGAPAGCERTGAIAWLTKPASFYAMSTYYQIVQPPYILLTSAQAALLGGVGLAMVMVDRSIAMRMLEALRNRVALILAVACITVPLAALVASDHGRLLHIWFTSAVIVFAAFLRAHREAAPSIPVHALGKPAVLARSLWVALFVAYVASWSAPGACCPDRLGAGFLGRVLRFIVQYL